MTRSFTGWHMLAILTAMFGIVVAVNVTMATFAVRTFGGTVVDNSYVASQEFNGWLDAARAQAKLGWTVAVTTDPDRRAAITVHAPAGLLEGAAITAVATHPLGRTTQQSFTFAAANGRYVSTRPLPAGRWLLRIRVVQGGRVALFDDEIPA